MFSRITLSPRGMHKNDFWWFGVKNKKLYIERLLFSIFLILFYPIIHLFLPPPPPPNLGNKTLRNKIFFRERTYKSLISYNNIDVQCTNVETTLYSVCCIINQKICITEFLKVKIKFFQGAQILKMSARSEKKLLRVCFAEFVIYF